MKHGAIVGGIAGLLLLPLPGLARLQAQEKAETLDTINADFEAGYKALEKERIERLGKLAATQARDQAHVTYEYLFRAAISSGLYVEAEATAKDHLKSKAYNATTGWLAVFVSMLAEAKRGAFEDSLASLENVIHADEQAVATEPAKQLKVSIPEAQRASLVDAYYQILVQADQFDVARKAMTLIQQKTKSNLIRRMVTNRIKQLNLVGKPAPDFRGTDLDGKPVQLADFRGKVVLLAFWSTWSLPSGELLARYEEFALAHKDDGLRVVAVNVDAMEDGVNAQSVVPEVRDFALDRNMRWPIVVDQPGPASIASAYGVSEIPSSILIDKQGKVVHLDLRASNLKAKVNEALGR